MYALVDCNNFFASCEQLFNPKLQDKPVVVLSNNDGCVIARSAQAKALGIPMAAPFWEWEDFCQRHDVAIFSANFALYTDMSSRVMTTIESLGLEYIPYSIDECFVKAERGEEIKKKVEQWTGISVSVGIGKTKTQAKLATHIAKQKNQVHHFHPEDLLHFPIEKIWGIGKKSSIKLKSYGIYTADQLIEKNDAWIKKHLSITGLRHVLELRGTSCIQHVQEPKKTILVSCSFRHGLKDRAVFREAVMSFIAKGARKLRQEGSRAGYLQLYTTPSHCAAGHTLPVASNYNPTLMTLAEKLICKVYQPGVSYKKIGIMLTDITKEKQGDFFTNDHEPMQLMRAMDQINQRHGKEMIMFAGEGKKWATPTKYRSPRYTTNWIEIPRAH